MFSSSDNSELRSSKNAEKKPLTQSQLVQTRQTAQLLINVFKPLIDMLPDHAQGASGMSRHLLIARTTCQRMVAALKETTPGPMTLVSLPGVQGLRQFLDAINTSCGGSQELGAARKAVDEFERLIKDLGGSQSRLRDRIQSQTSQYDRKKGVSEQAKQRLFEAAVAVTGRECDVLLNVFTFRLNEENPEQLECASTHGMIGNVVRSAGMPVYFTMGRVHRTNAVGTDIVTLEQGSSSIFPDFCSSPHPKMRLETTGKDSVLHILDNEAYEDGEVIDVVFANRTMDPMVHETTGEYTLNAVWALMNCPCRHQVLDVYLHKDIERLFRPDLDLQLWNPSLNPPANHRWVTQFPIHPQLQLLGLGLGRAACAAYPRHQELTQFLFNKLHWESGEYIGFRCEMSYPIWRSGVCMMFTPIEERH